MSKIEEMALVYGNKHQGTVDIEVFEAGANAVLKEIEESLNKGMSVSEGYSEAMRVIKELKGE